MIIIPEIETVVILVPRTGSGALRRAVAKTYPASMLLYRHMEADGLPLGYDRWRRVGVLRHPVDRLWSLHKFLRDFGGTHDPAYIAAMRAQGARPFEEWLLNNETPFTSPYDSAGRGRYIPGFTVRHPLPENRKSQLTYLRPDLGTIVFPYRAVDTLAATLGVELERHNATPAEPPPELSRPAKEHMACWFAADFARLAMLDGGLDHAEQLR